MRLQDLDAATWRDRVLPKTALGLSMLILSASLGAAFSGSVLYAYYDYRLNRSEDRVSKFVNGFDKRFKAATDTIRAEADSAKADIRKQAGGNERGGVDATSTVEGLLKKVAPSVWFVHSLDEAGQPSVGSGFVVASDSEQTFVLTSFSTVRAATRKPGPDVMVRQGADDIKATLFNWQEERDLALLIVPKANQARLPWAGESPPARTGERVFSVSGLGAGGGAITQGAVADISAVAIQHSASVGPAFQGGPLLTARGDVLGVSSISYAPLGFNSQSVFFAVPIRAACEKVLRCPGGDQAQPGQRSP